ncbi:hypothetical protein GCM10010191_50480 [Actinomadura vinacea]|uniref:Sulfotransferase family protein n=1 Tax=Actinomadura vinacea TaxID=115336 RepID=A0ABP5WR61_9ACTN
MPEHLLLQLQGSMEAEVDWPASYYWRELADAYPEAKVVLTVRDPHKWHPSIRMLLSRENRPDPSDEMPEQARHLFATMERVLPLLSQMGRAHFGPDWAFGDDLADEELVVAAFNRHVETVKQSIPAERLLVFDVREGWKPLCAFLGVDVPAGEPFPHLNDAESMRQAFERMRTGDMSTFPFDRPGS